MGSRKETGETVTQPVGMSLVIEWYCLNVRCGSGERAGEQVQWLEGSAALAEDLRFAQYVLCGSPSSVSPVPEIHCSLLGSLGTKHAISAWMYIETKHSKTHNE